MPKANKRLQKTESRAAIRVTSDTIGLTGFQNPDLQKRCMLFSLPLEIRRMVYELALAEVEVPDGRYVSNVEDADLEGVRLESATCIDTRPAVQHHVWLRPGCTVRTRINVDLLQTGKRIYNEVHLLPTRLKHHKCYHVHGPIPEPNEYFKSFTPGQLSQVRTLHIYTQQHGLDENNAFLRTQLKRVAPNLEHLTITLRNCSSTGAATISNTQLLINPYRLGRARQDDMMENMQAGEAGENLMMPKSGWAGAFTHLPALKSLTMEFEHHEGFAMQLERLASWAQKWRFPLHDNRVLVARSAAHKESWRGLHIHDSFRCRDCGLVKPQQTQASMNCTGCQWRRLGKGPLMITWKVIWEAREGTLFEDMNVKPRAVKASPVSRRELDGLRTDRGSRTLRPGSGLDSIFQHASSDQIDELIRYGIL